MQPAAPPPSHPAPPAEPKRATLTSEQRAAVPVLARRLGVKRLAKELGISRSSVGSLVCNCALPLVEAQAARELPRLIAEVLVAEGDDAG